MTRTPTKDSTDTILEQANRIKLAAREAMSASLEVAKLLSRRIQLMSEIDQIDSDIGLIARSTTGSTMSDSSPKRRRRNGNISSPLADAAEKVLREKGVPMSAPQIVNVYDYSGKSVDPRGTLFQTLRQSKRFVRVTKGKHKRNVLWRLSERGKH